MTRTAIQLYTLRKFEVSQATEVRIAAETDIDAVEMMYYGSVADETLTALDETGLDVAGLTVGLEDHLQGPIDEIIETCERLDCDTVILGHLDESHFESEQATRETAEMLDSFADLFENRGFRFLYHTHRHEFDHKRNDDETYLDLLVDETDQVEFELDLGWVGVAGADPADTIEAVSPRVASVHLKDMDFETEEFVNLGDGDLNIDRAARTAIEEGVDWLVYEHEDPPDPIESVVTGASKLQKYKYYQPTTSD